MNLHEKEFKTLKDLQDFIFSEEIEAFSSDDIVTIQKIDTKYLLIYWSY